MLQLNRVIELKPIFLPKTSFFFFINSSVTCQAIPSVSYLFTYWVNSIVRITNYFLTSPILSVQKFWGLSFNTHSELLDFLLDVRNIFSNFLQPKMSSTVSWQFLLKCGTPISSEIHTTVELSLLSTSNNSFEKLFITILLTLREFFTRNLLRGSSLKNYFLNFKSQINQNP